MHARSLEGPVSSVCQVVYYMISLSCGGSTWEMVRIPKCVGVKQDFHTHTVMNSGSELICAPEAGLCGRAGSD